MGSSPRQEDRGPEQPWITVVGVVGDAIIDRHEACRACSSLRAESGALYDVCGAHARMEEPLNVPFWLWTRIN